MELMTAETLAMKRGAKVLIQNVYQKLGKDVVNGRILDASDKRKYIFFINSASRLLHVPGQPIPLSK